MPVPSATLYLAWIFSSRTILSPRTWSSLSSPLTLGTCVFSCRERLETRPSSCLPTSSTPVPSIYALSTQDGSNTTRSLCRSVPPLLPISVLPSKWNRCSNQPQSSTISPSICRLLRLPPPVGPWKRQSHWPECCEVSSGRHCLRVSTLRS